MEVFQPVDWDWQQIAGKCSQILMKVSNHVCMTSRLFCLQFLYIRKGQSEKVRWAGFFFFSERFVGEQILSPATQRRERFKNTSQRAWCCSMKFEGHRHSLPLKLEVQSEGCGRDSWIGRSLPSQHLSKQIFLVLHKERSRHHNR